MTVRCLGLESRVTNEETEAPRVTQQGWGGPAAPREVPHRSPGPLPAPLHCLCEFSCMTLSLSKGRSFSGSTRNVVYGCCRELSERL